MSAPLLSFVIVSYNNFEYLRQCLRSIYGSHEQGFEVIIVDNDSTEPGLDQIQAEFSLAIILRQQKNEGFARGNNIGIRRAHGQYVFLLNNDAVLFSGIWDQIPSFFTEDPTLGALQPKIILDDGLINNCGLEVQYLGFAWDKYYQTEAGNITAPAALAAFSGAAVIIKKKVLDEVGNFDEAYFMYHEDVDLSFRLRQAGYRIMLFPEYVVQHHYRYKRDPRRYYWLERNRVVTLLKNYPLKMLLFILPAGLLMELGMLGFSLANKWFLKKIRSYLDIVLMIPNIISARRRLSRKITGKTFFESLVGPVTFTEVTNPVLNRIANPILNAYWQIVKKLL